MMNRCDVGVFLGGCGTTPQSATLTAPLAQGSLADVRLCGSRAIRESPLRRIDELNGIIVGVGVHNDSV